MTARLFFFWLQSVALKMKFIVVIMLLGCTLMFSIRAHNWIFFLLIKQINVYYQTDDKTEDSTQEVKPEDDKKESKGNSVKGVADNG